MHAVTFSYCWELTNDPLPKIIPEMNEGSR